MVINEVLFRETEDRIRNYFRKDKRIKNLKENIKFLEDSIEIIKTRMENNHFTIPSNLKSIEFSERVQSSCSGSPIEQSMIRIYEGYEKRIARNLEEINRLEILIMDIKEDYNIIKNNIEDNFNEEDKIFLEEAYNKCESNWKLANKYHMSEASCTRKKKRLLRQMILWEKDRLSEIK